MRGKEEERRKRDAGEDEEHAETREGRNEVRNELRQPALRFEPVDDDEQERPVSRRNNDTVVPKTEHLYTRTAKIASAHPTQNARGQN